MTPELQILKTLEMYMSAVMVTVCETSGSVPRGPGAKLVVFENGSISGTIGGGSIEAKAIQNAKEMLGKPNTVITHRYQLNTGNELNMLCGGTLTLMFESFLSGKSTVQQFLKFGKSLEQPEGLIWKVDFKTSTRMLCTLNEIQQIHPGSIKKPIYKEGEFYLEPVLPQSKLFLVGAGHVAAAVADMAMKVDFNIIVIDDRVDLLTTDRFPKNTTFKSIDQFSNIATAFTNSTGGYIVILTRNHSFDEAVLEAALNTNACYIGMIGSRKKRNTIYDNLKVKGITEDLLNTVKSPIGLNIGAETPEEIAVSIIAELIHERSK